MWNTRIVGLVALEWMCCSALGAAELPPAQIIVDTSQTYQTIEGFGTCLISWDQRFQNLYRTPEFQDIYVNRVGCNMLRINLWGPVMPKPVEDWRQIRWQDFDMSVDGGRARIFVEFAAALRKLNPDLRCIGTVWSPPAWMKVNGSITDRRSAAIRAGNYGDVDNRVKPEYFPHFVKWLVEMVKLHKAQGAPLYAVSPGNEVQFTQSFESCVWTAEDLARILEMLAQQLAAEGLAEVKLFAPETMTSHFYPGGTGDYLKMIQSRPGAAKAIGAYASHGYEDGFKAEMSANSSRMFWEAIRHTGKPFWITEGGTGGHDWPEPLHQGVAAALHNALVAGNVSAFVPWQITESQKNEHGLMLMDQFTPKTYAAMHYFRFIRPGAVRVAAEPAHGPVKVGAFVHRPSGAITVVLINDMKAEQTVELLFRPRAATTAFRTYRTSAGENLAKLPDTRMRSGRASLAMPAESIVTLHVPGRAGK